ncbi:Signal transduction histidine kinase [Algoriphagus faecimaris]|uniref:histidine kinase n=1 Tax=Algoriphagus faecimaris TaxID=686796 RepID=A0A1G6W2B7_9BACT|nr:tetratricopeptide repeat-containing sensor histidine kinase [Algoriphagus faecimaris]SDD60022.1 Signal transduction histidine kinase [Algoriphagus faecimaris]
MTRQLYLVFISFLVLYSPTVLAQGVKFDSLVSQAKRLLYTDSDSAMYFLVQAEKKWESEQEDKKLREGILQNVWGALNYIKGDYAASMRYYSAALEILEDEQNLPELVYALNGRALIYLSQHEYEKSIEIFNQCIAINKELKDSTALAKNHFNKSISEDESGKNEAALQSLEEALGYLKGNESDPLYLMSINRRAKIYYELGELAKSKENYFEIIQNSEDANNWELTFAYSGLAEVALAEGNPQQAIQYGTTSLGYAEKVKALWDKERATAVLYQAYEDLGSFEDALVYSRLNKTYSDSLYNQNKNAEISYLQLQLTEAENQVLKNEQETSKKEIALSRNLLIVLLVGLGIAIAAIFLFQRLLRQKNKYNQNLSEKQKEIEARNQKLTAINEEKNKLFSILSHDLKAPINSIKQLLELEELGLFKEDEKIKARGILIKQVNATQDMINELLQWAHAQLDGIITKREPIELQKIIESQIKHLEFQALGKGIHIDWKEEKELSRILADPQQVKIIVQNCLQNAIKFSHRESSVQVSVEESENYIELIILDQGIGIPPEKLNEINTKMVRVESSEGTNKEKGTGLGLLLVRQFVEKNKGKFHINSQVNQGTEVRISFEKEKKP